MKQPLQGIPGDMPDFSTLWVEHEQGARSISIEGIYATIDVRTLRRQEKTFLRYFAIIQIGLERKWNLPALQFDTDSFTEAKGWSELWLRFLYGVVLREKEVARIPAEQKNLFSFPERKPTLKELRNVLYGITHTTYLAEQPELEQALRTAGELLLMFDQLYQLVSTMPGFSTPDTMTQLWIETRDRLLAMIREKVSEEKRSRKEEEV